MTPSSGRHCTNLVTPKKEEEKGVKYPWLSSRHGLTWANERRNNFTVVDRRLMLYRMLTPGRAQVAEDEEEGEKKTKVSTKFFGCDLLRTWEECWGNVFTPVGMTR